MTRLAVSGTSCRRCSTGFRSSCSRPMRRPLRRAPPRWQPRSTPVGSAAWRSATTWGRSSRSSERSWTARARTRARSVERWPRCSATCPTSPRPRRQLADASTERARVVSLLEVLVETNRLLRGAEERVHRDLAPILAAAITRWLPRVSGGAYVDASVDPADLSVRVKEAKSGRWRSALLLSEGTREQIYLLLRVAMAQQLATTGETAPLLLDEVTVQADTRAQAAAARRPSRAERGAPDHPLHPRRRRHRMGGTDARWVTGSPRAAARRGTRSAGGARLTDAR